MTHRSGPRRDTLAAILLASEQAASALGDSRGSIYQARSGISPVPLTSETVRSHRAPISGESRQSPQIRRVREISSVKFATRQFDV